MHTGDFTDEEVERARRYLAGSWVFDYQTVEQRAGASSIWNAGASRSTNPSAGPTGSRSHPPASPPRRPTICRSGGAHPRRVRPHPGPLGALECA